ncbi:MAG: MraY family glycosyltransferase [Candidatus Peribacteraceae bacterium]|nr:MraY family glycosyltransferase [Candidatus Peribacteraceae bacterium]
MPTPLLWTPLLAFAASVILHALALKLFPRWGLLDFPERYGYARPRIPYPTGIVSVALFLAFFLCLERWNAQTGSVAAAVILLATFSFIDDRTPLPPLLRAGVQAVAGLVIFWGGAQVYSFTNPFEHLAGGAVIPLDRWRLTVPLLGNIPVWSAVFTVFWIGLTTNALNWFDGIPGQVPVLATIGFLTIGFLSLSARVDQPSLALIAFVLAGIGGGCLLFGLPGNRMVIGDTGAMFFGLMLGVLTIYSGGKVATAFLVLGVPLVDFALVIGRRILKGKSILKGDMRDEHLHHRLLRKGWNRGAIIALTAGLGTLFGISALFFSTQEKIIAAAVLFLVMLGLSVYSRPREGSGKGLVEETGTPPQP